jgi:hypothetical protein
MLTARDRVLARHMNIGKWAGSGKPPLQIRPETLYRMEAGAAALWARRFTKETAK